MLRRRHEYDILPPEPIIDAIMELWTAAYGTNRHYAYERSEGGRHSIRSYPSKRKDLITNYRAWEDLALLTELLARLGGAVLHDRGWRDVAQEALQALKDRSPHARRHPNADTERGEHLYKPGHGAVHIPVAAISVEDPDTSVPAPACVWVTEGGDPASAERLNRQQEKGPT